MTKYVIPKTEFIEDIRKLLDDRRLIILQEAVKYCREKNVDKIRYSDLKRRCNDRLSDLTDGYQTDFGGSFENYIIDLESNSEPNKTFLKRYKQKPKKSFIIPDIPKIINLLNKKRLNNLVKTIESSKEPYGAISLFDSSPSGYYGYGIAYGPYAFLTQDEANLGKSAATYTSNSFDIYISSPEDKSFHLTDEDIKQFQLLGNIIASRDKTMPYNITLKYKGEAHSSEKEELCKEKDR
jgi:hypothetical protein